MVVIVIISFIYLLAAKNEIMCSCLSILLLPKNSSETDCGRRITFGNKWIIKPSNSEYSSKRSQDLYAKGQPNVLKIGNYTLLVNYRCSIQNKRIEIIQKKFISSIYKNCSDQVSLGWDSTRTLSFLTLIRCQCYKCDQFCSSVKKYL